jgi:hypothetical protein
LQTDDGRELIAGYSKTKLTRNSFHGNERD